jgi:NADH dehydrogenase
VILLDAGPAVLRPMGANLGNKAQARLQRMGVEMQLGARVVDVDRDGLTVKNSDGKCVMRQVLAKRACAYGHHSQTN